MSFSFREIPVRSFWCLLHNFVDMGEERYGKFFERALELEYLLLHGQSI